MDVKGKCNADQRLFSCTRCPESFKDTLELRTHFFQTHGNAPVDRITAERDPLDKKKTHRCDQCPLAYTTSGILKAHVNFKHKGLKLHKCGLCEKRFGWPSNLSDHVRRAHKADMDSGQTSDNKSFARGEAMSINASTKLKRARIQTSIQGSEPSDQLIDNSKSNASLRYKNVYKSINNSVLENVIVQKVSKSGQNSEYADDASSVTVNKRDKRNAIIKPTKATLFAKSIPEAVKLKRRSLNKARKRCSEAKNDSSEQQSRNHHSVKLNDNRSEINNANKSDTSHEQEASTTVYDGPWMADRRSLSAICDQYTEEDVKPFHKHDKPHESESLLSERDQILSAKEQSTFQLKTLEQAEEQLLQQKEEILSQLRSLEQARKEVEMSLQLTRMDKDQIQIQLRKYRLVLGED